MPAYDCRTCGACCREAFDTVEVDEGDPFVQHHPELLAKTPFERWGVIRRGAWCAALRRGADGYTCTVYRARPRPCREVEVDGPACRFARQRLGLPVTPAAGADEGR